VAPRESSAPPARRLGERARLWRKRRLARPEADVIQAWFADPARRAAVHNSSAYRLSFSRAAGHRAVVPLWLPAQLHLHDPWPLTAEAVPVPQRPVFGTLVMAAPFAEPQARSREGASRRKRLPDGRR
jgi:hypothetical protein